MSFENTIRKHDPDATMRQHLQSMQSNDGDYDPNLAVDGLSDFVISRLLKVLGLGRRQH